MQARSESASTAGEPIRVAHVIFRLDIGGLENGLVNVINGLPAGQFEHIVICLDTYTEFRHRIVRDDVKLVALNKKPGLDPRMYGRLWKLLRKLKPDVVHTRNLGTLPCIAVAAVAGVAVRIHGEHGWDMVDIQGQEFRYRWLRKLISPLVTVHVAVSGHIVDWLVSSVGISASKVVRISNGVDTRRFSPTDEGDEKAQVNGVFAMPGSRVKGKIVIGTVGRLEPVKDQQSLIVGLGLLKQQRPDLASNIEAIMVGDGSLAVEFGRLAEEHGVGKLLRLAGRQDNIPAFLRDMDIFVLPSLNEGISNTILEAMATGLPVVATAVGGTPEIVSDGRTGTLIPVSDPQALAEALIRYCDNPGLRIEHGRAARELVQASMSLDSMVGNYLSLYLKSVGRA